MYCSSVLYAKGIYLVWDPLISVSTILSNSACGVMRGDSHRGSFVIGVLCECGNGRFLGIILRGVMGGDEMGRLSHELRKCIISYNKLPQIHVPTVNSTHIRYIITLLNPDRHKMVRRYVNKMYE